VVEGQVWGVGSALLDGHPRLQQCLTDTGHVAVPEDAEARCDETVFGSVPLAVLVGKKADESLTDRQSDRL
jgi:hypothetical protein